MQIAKAEISADPSVTGDLLRLSDGLLTVADVLQFFPEFATIDHFKQALCSSLVAVSKQIDEYQEKLEQTQTSAQHVRDELKEVNKESQVVSAQSKCALCFAPLLNNSFLGKCQIQSVGSL